MTYKKIAELAGVSVSTVSKVMSGNPEISKETAKRILEIAKEHDTAVPRYHHSRAGVRVAIIVHEIDSVFYSRAVTAIASELEKRGVMPSVYISGFDKKKLSRIIDSITDSGFDGIISLTGAVLEKPMLPPKIWFLSYTVPNGDSISIDYESAIYESVEYLLRLGHTDIGFVGEKNTKSKLDSFRMAAARLNIPLNEKNIFVSNKRFEEIGYEAAGYFSSRKNLPTALLCAYDEVAMGAIYAFKHRGIKVPEDISIIGINDIPFAAYADVPLTTISLTSADSARLVAELMCERINRIGDAKPKHILLKGELIIRKTVTKPRCNKTEEKK